MVVFLEGRSFCAFTLITSLSLCLLSSWKKPGGCLVAHECRWFTPEKKVLKRGAATCPRLERAATLPNILKPTSSTAGIFLQDQAHLQLVLRVCIPCRSYV
ncbi:hypothetical protein BV22DRAFT_1028071 [Leucogyrophana mollusca]|uniref:Uncharacterized protein n=1 Tax=Leucogyrophana mollusca TaxID=85980 RepID=A0ACB8BY63_9AGAM|nr:hypothetical protein BV22DRAFT_1028071 [Leucogyrophana mollusca]